MWSWFLSYLPAIGAVLVPGAFSFVLHHVWQSQRLKRATELFAYASSIGVKVAYARYTEEAKSLAPDGKLTDAQKSMARFQALQAALAALGDRGVKLAKGAYAEGFDKALEHALEAAYVDFQPTIPAVVPVVKQAA